MNLPKYLIIAFVSLIGFSASIHAQKAQTSFSVFVDLSGNTPSEITISQPLDLVEKSRGFKPVNTKQITIAGKITDAQGIKMVLVNKHNIFLNELGEFNLNLPLAAGMNDISFEVTDNEDDKTVKIFQVEMSDMIIPTGNGEGNYYALLIGANEYDDPEIMDLDRPIADAKNLGNILLSNYTFKRENIVYLENPSRAAIVDELDKLRRIIGTEDNLLIFYAGHGYWDQETETGYWIPSNGTKSSTSNWLGNSTLTDQLRGIKSKHTLLIADACFAGSIFKSRSVTIAEEQVAIKKLYELPSRKAMTSGTLTEVADKSVFLEYLTGRLAANTEKYLTAGDLFNSLQKAVINNSDVVPQYGTMQKVGDQGGDFIFIRK
jgi:hypothetical protein